MHSGFVVTGCQIRLTDTGICQLIILIQPQYLLPLFNGLLLVSVIPKSNGFIDERSVLGRIELQDRSLICVQNNDLISDRLNSNRCCKGSLLAS